MNWQDRITVKKGLIGESLVNTYLIEHGFIPYSPDASGAHPFDKLCASRDKRTIFIADSKAKPARKYYPDTGIDIRHYKDYQFIQKKHNLNVFLFFVDEDKEEIYGNFLKTLDKPREIYHNGICLTYPWEQNGIRYYPLIAMLSIGKIPVDDLQQLRKFSTRKIDYA